ncbi:MAG: aspartate--tRNA ligase [Candidatus Altiarchaeota archaeon]|nr:aspartate--tRNA ligase [Candidatus Altiarchaeota archaeon]
MSKSISRVLRTHTCGELTKKDEGKEVVLAGWAHNIRKFGKKAFVDLRDRYGITQLVLDEKLKDIYDSLTKESVLIVSGKVEKRKDINPEMQTGEIEIMANTLVVASKAERLPFEIFNPSVESTEETRLKYRYLDLRRGEMQRMLEFRFRAEMIIRNYFQMKEFVEVETPQLSKPTPEGARDFLIPSRVIKKNFWALPQSPQQYKQLLMVAGIDKYFQIVRCFRDEDLRKDRQYEFTQIDVEMSFVDENDVMALAEGMTSVLYSQLLGIKLDKPFPKITWHDALDKYGSDKPDLRFELSFVDVTTDFEDSGLRIFEAAVKGGGVVKAIFLRELLTRSEIKKLEDVAKTHGFPGVAWVKYDGDELSGSIASKLTDNLKQKFSKKKGTTLIMAGEWLPTVLALGGIRLALGDKFNLKKGLSVLWVTEFPLFEWSETLKSATPMHHPFTSPLKGFEAHLGEKISKEDTLNIPSRAYDIVINGVEIGGGSIRITDHELQEKMLKTLGINKTVAQEKFGMLLDAFKYGVPPHGGIAFGFDRLLQVMLQTDSIRDVIAFPKNKSGRAPMEDAPSKADKEALKELGLRCK